MKSSTVEMPGFRRLVLWNKCIRIRMKSMFFQLTLIIFSCGSIDLYVNG